MNHLRIRRGLTLVEVCVIVLVATVAVAVALPPLASIGCESSRVVSRKNLRILGEAHVAYAADWEGRQFTAVPDDLGAFGGCAGYLNAGGCIDGISLGLDCRGSAVDIPIGCAGSGPGCINFSFSRPFNFLQTDHFGSYRIPNAAGFHEYVDGRFYSPLFYAPDDAGVIEFASPYFNAECGYAGPAGVEPIWSSYIRSPAAMFDPAVLSRQSGYKNPNTLANGYKSPPLGAAAYPHLKSHMIEHNAIENTFGPCNPAVPGCVPYRFNQVFETRPLALMYDGSVRILSPRDAMESDSRAQVAAAGSSLLQKGLWIRNTPFGSFGLGGTTAADLFVRTSYHYLTGDGILGRDVLD